MDYEGAAAQICKLFEGREGRKVANLLDGFKGTYVVLRILRDSDTEVQPGDIAKKMDISTARVAAALNALCRKGYVKRVRAAHDGRRVVAEITPSGIEALSERERVVHGLIASFLNKLTDEEAETFILLAEKLFR